MRPSRMNASLQNCVTLLSIRLERLTDCKAGYSFTVTAAEVLASHQSRLYASAPARFRAFTLGRGTFCLTVSRTPGSSESDFSGDDLS